MSVKDAHWARPLLGVSLAVMVSLAGAGFLVWRDAAINDQRLEINVAAINSNIEAIASNAETLATVSRELPLIRQALVRDQELISVVIGGVKEDLTALNNRLSTYIGIDNQEQEGLADRLHDLEMQVNVHSHGGTGRQDRGQ